MQSKKFRLLLSITGLCFTTSPLYAYKIAITQIVSHPALNAVRDGIQEVLADDAEISFSLSDAGGNIATAGQISQKLAQDPSVDMIIAISTPSAQSAIAATRGLKPVLFAAISDPIGAKLLNKKGVGQNVTGVTDRPPLAEQIDFIRELQPNIDTIGIVYNAGEDNVRATIQSLEKILKPLKIKLITRSITRSSEIPVALHKIAPQVDAFFIPNDNMMASSIVSVVKTAHTHHKPVYAADILLVEQGCLGMRGVDYQDIGRQTAQLAQTVRASKATPRFQEPKIYRTYINQKAADDLRLIIPKKIIKNADKVFPFTEKTPNLEDKKPVEETR